MIRSGALFTLGTFNFVVSMLPPTLVKIASFAGGGTQVIRGSTKINPPIKTIIFAIEHRR